MSVIVDRSSRLPKAMESETTSSPYQGEDPLDENSFEGDQEEEKPVKQSNPKEKSIRIRSCLYGGKVLPTFEGEYVDYDWVPELKNMPVYVYTHGYPDSIVLKCDKCKRYAQVEHGLPGTEIKPGPGDRGYIFRCSQCGPGRQTFEHGEKTWLDITLTCLYNLELTDREKGGQRFFHVRKEICSFADKHWDVICKGTATWWATLNAQITTRTDLFETIRHGSGKWALVFSNISKLNGSRNPDEEKIVHSVPSTEKRVTRRSAAVTAEDTGDGEYDDEPGMARSPKRRKPISRTSSATITPNGSSPTFRSSSNSPLSGSLGSSNNNGTVGHGAKGQALKAPETAAPWCHLCKREKSARLVTCRNVSITGCRKRYCVSCLKQHYNEAIEPMSPSTWTCVSCRAICKCAACRQKRGDPTVNLFDDHVGIMETRHIDPAKVEFVAARSKQLIVATPSDKSRKKTMSSFLLKLSAPLSSPTDNVHPAAPNFVWVRPQSDEEWSNLTSQVSEFEMAFKFRIPLTNEVMSAARSFAAAEKPAPAVNSPAYYTNDLDSSSPRKKKMKIETFRPNGEPLTFSASSALAKSSHNNNLQKGDHLTNGANGHSDMDSDEEEPGAQQRNKRKNEKISANGEGSNPPKITLKDLIDNGIITPGEKLTFKNVGDPGTLQPDGTIKWGSESFNSLSTFAKNAAKISPVAPRASTHNGWSVVYAKGQAMRHFRDQYMKMMGIDAHTAAPITGTPSSAANGSLSKRRKLEEESHAKLTKSSAAVIVSNKDPQLTSDDAHNAIASALAPLSPKMSPLAFSTSAIGPPSFGHANAYHGHGHVHIHAHGAGASASSANTVSPFAMHMTNAIDPFAWSATSASHDYGGAHVVADLSAFSDSSFLSDFDGMESRPSTEGSAGFDHGNADALVGEFFV